MTKNTIFLKVKDYSVSEEEFDLLCHHELDMLITSPQPEEQSLADYYKSEDYISHTSHRRTVFEFVYHLVRKIALKRKLALLNGLPLKSKRLLDIGCGTGDFIEFADRKGWEVCGVEPNEKARGAAARKVTNAVHDVNHLSDLKPGSFDVITLWHVLEHLPDLQKHLDIFKNTLSSNGHLIIAVPNFKSYDAKYYNNFWAAYDVPRHLWHFSRSSIKELIKPYGFELLKEQPMLFDAFYVSLLSEKYKTGRMNPINALWIGLISNLKARRTKEYSSIIYVLKKRNT